MPVKDRVKDTGKEVKFEPVPVKNGQVLVKG